jgi:hypothetical protein
MKEWDGSYTKQFYKVLTPEGEYVLCWPNDGAMEALDGTRRFWTRSTGLKVQALGFLSNILEMQDELQEMTANSGKFQRRRDAERIYARPPRTQFK